MEASVKALAGPEPERDEKFPRRYCPPAHYVVEINSVKELLEFDTYKFGVFEAGGYKWRLCLRPKGDKGPGGKVYMSLYLSIEEPNKLGDRNVVVDYKFFVYKYPHGPYVTIKEKGEELTTLNKENTQCGLSKFLSWKSLYDPTTGFLKGNCCKFGAEVMVSKTERKEETLTIVKDPPHNRTTCHIRQFSPLKKEFQCSGEFFLGKKEPYSSVKGKWNWLWMLKVAQKGKQLSVYLEAQGLVPGINMYVKAKLQLVNQKHRENDKEQTVRGWLSAEKKYCGCQEFMPWKDLENGGFVKKKEIVNKKEKRNGESVYEKELEFKVKILVISDAVQRNKSV